MILLSFQDWNLRLENIFKCSFRINPVLELSFNSSNSSESSKNTTGCCRVQRSALLTLAKLV